MKKGGIAIKRRKICKLSAVFVTCLLLAIELTAFALTPPIDHHDPRPIIPAFLQKEDAVIEKYDLTFKLNRLFDKEGSNTLTQTIALKSQSGGKTVKIIVPVYKSLNEAPIDIKLDGESIVPELRFAGNLFNSLGYFGDGLADKYKSVSVKQELEELSADNQYILKGIDPNAEVACYTFELRTEIDGSVWIPFEFDQSKTLLIIDPGKNGFVNDKPNHDGSFIDVDCKAGVVYTVYMLVIGEDTVKFETMFMPSGPRQSMTPEQYEASKQRYEAKINKESIVPESILWKYVHLNDFGMDHEKYNYELAKVYLDMLLASKKVIDVKDNMAYVDTKVCLIGHVIEVPLEENTQRVLTITYPILMGFNVLDDKTAQHFIPILFASLTESDLGIKPEITIENSLNPEKIFRENRLIKVDSDKYAVEYDKANENMIIGFTMPYKAPGVPPDYLLIGIINAFWPVILVVLVVAIVIVIRRRKARRNDESSAE